MLHLLDVIVLLSAPLLAFIFGVVVVNGWQFLLKQPLYTLQHQWVKITQG